MSERYDLAVLGDPVGHSRSPAMHEAGLVAAGLSGTYVAIQVDEAGMAFQAERLRCLELHGANITMPHKRIAARLADVLTPTAARAGAVNTWYMVGDDLIGESTDVHGVRQVFSRRSLPIESILVLGSGGAAAAALVACDGYQITISARSESKATALLEQTGVEAHIVEWGTGVSGATVVNATPIGMRGDALPAAVVSQAAALFDMTYGGDVSPALAAAMAEGRPVADGIDLLAAQAEESFRIWTGVQPPNGLFESVARNVSRTPTTSPIQERSE
jgi:shikimate dehydrogenase